MSVFLVPVDGSEFSSRAIDYVIRRVREQPGSHQVHVLNVQMPLVGVNVKLLISAERLQGVYREEGEKLVQPAIDALRSKGIPATPHIGVGDASEVINEFSASLSADEIVMGSHGRGALAGAIMGSVAQKVVNLTKIPVVLLK